MLNKSNLILRQSYSYNYKLTHYYKYTRTVSQHCPSSWCIDSLCWAWNNHYISASFGDCFDEDCLSTWFSALYDGSLISFCNQIVRKNITAQSTTLLLQNCTLLCYTTYLRRLECFTVHNITQSFLVVGSDESLKLLLCAFHSFWFKLSKSSPARKKKKKLNLLILRYLTN